MAVLLCVLVVLGRNRIFEGGAWFVFQTQTTPKWLLLWRVEATRGLRCWFLLVGCGFYWWRYWLVRVWEWLVSVWLRVGELFGGLSTVCYRPYFLVLVMASF